MKRPKWDEYFISMAKLAGTRSPCLSRQVGAVIVRDNQVLSTGYNGPPRGLPHCDDLGCLRKELGIKTGERYDICRAVHAEQNAILQAARTGAAVEGADMYCTLLPCDACCKAIINAGIRRFFYTEDYGNEKVKEAFYGKVQLIHLSEEEGE